MTDDSARRDVPEAEAEWTAAEAGEKSRANRKTLVVLLAVGIGMFGFAFANVPLFGLLCKAVGIELNPNREGVETGGPGRSIEVVFMGSVHGNLPISLAPVERIQKVVTGAQSINDYKFVNMKAEPVYFRPVHSVTPTRRAADHFELHECFCFDDQKLEPSQSIALPVVYTIGTDLPEDIGTVTLNYTLFELTEKDYAESVAAKAKADAAAAEDAP